MARSGSTDYISSRDQIINRALRVVGAAQNGVSPSTTETSNAALALNALVKELHEEGYLWTREWIQHVPTASSLVLGSDGESYECIRDHTSSTTTEPITGSDYKSYWRLKSGAVSGWADATSYSSIGQFKIGTGYVEVEQMFSREANTDVPIEIMDFAEYLQRISHKIVEGRPSIGAINKSYDNNHEVHLYPFPTVGYTIHLLVRRELMDFDASADNPDFPKRFENMLIYGLAVHLSGEYGIPISHRQWIEAQYEKTKRNLKGTDVVNRMKWVEGLY